MKISPVNFINYKVISKNNSKIQNKNNSLNNDYLLNAKNINFRASVNIKELPLVDEIEDAKSQAADLYSRTQAVKANAFEIKKEVDESIAMLEKLAEGKSKFSIKANDTRYFLETKHLHDEEYIDFWTQYSYKEKQNGEVVRIVEKRGDNRCMTVVNIDPETGITDSYTFTNGILQDAQLGLNEKSALFGDYEKIHYDMIDGTPRSYKKFGKTDYEVSKYATWDDDGSLEVFGATVYYNGTFGDYSGKFYQFDDGKFIRIKNTHHIY